LIIKKIDDMKKRKINNLKEIENHINYICFQEKNINQIINSSNNYLNNYSNNQNNYQYNIKNIEKIHKLKAKLYEDKKNTLKQILFLKSAFSIIDEMFIKEMENVEIKKKYWFRRYFLFGFGLKDKTIEPRKINKFIGEIMTPFSNENYDNNNDDENYQKNKFDKHNNSKIKLFNWFLSFFISKNKQNNDYCDIENGIQNNNLNNFINADEYVNKIINDINLYDNNIKLLKIDYDDMKKKIKKIEKKYNRINKKNKYNTNSDHNLNNFKNNCDDDCNNNSNDDDTNDDDTNDDDTNDCDDDCDDNNNYYYLNNRKKTFRTSSFLDIDNMSTEDSNIIDSNPKQNNTKKKLL
jgi:hypothetical protein